MVAGTAPLIGNQALAFVIGAYFLGAIPFGLLLARRRGVDVRLVGSGNIGATNVARTLGKKLGALVLLLDALKGAGPTWYARSLVEQGRLDVEVMAAVAIAGITGHCFCIWLKFHGGKGVATSLGVFLVVDPLSAGIGVLIFAGVYAAFRLVAISSVVAAIAFPFLLWLFGRDPALVNLGIGVALIIVIKHRSNLKRVFHGTELKL